VTMQANRPKRLPTPSRSAADFRPGMSRWMIACQK
jgi:hypothetical protein